MATEIQSHHRRSRWEVARTALLVLGGVGLVAGVVGSLHYGAQLLAIRRGNLRTPTTIGPRRVATTPLRFTELRLGRRDTVTLALTSGPGLLLLYSTACNVCSDNMPRWLDLVAELRRSGSAAPVYAIDLDGRDSLGTYWPRMQAVRLLTPLDRGSFPDQLGVRGTPASVVVHRGSIDATILGILGARRRAYLISLLKS